MKKASSSKLDACSSGSSLLAFSFGFLATGLRLGHCFAWLRGLLGLGSITRLLALWVFDLLFLIQDRSNLLFEADSLAGPEMDG